MPSEQPRNVDDALDALLVPARSRTKYSLWLWMTSLLMLSLLILYLSAWRAPGTFESGERFTVQSGTTLTQNSILLYDAGLIRSAFWFKAWTTLLAGNDGLKAGTYFFENPVNIFGVSRRLSNASFGQESVRVTIPEGTNTQQIAQILKSKLEGFNEQAFMEASKGREGYLFPDTYNIQPGTHENDIVKMFSDSFTQRIKTIEDAISAFGHPLEEVIIMASLLEEEARTMETRREISGILWNRIEIGMPLQVDAVFPYIIGKNTFQLTTEDLKIDSPYNTYKYPGLPLGPITNPGLDSILAAVTPNATTYLYYLSDTHGAMHYAVSHKDHVLNKEKYLR